jgi:hydrocephalus-inducing protein
MRSFTHDLLASVCGAVLPLATMSGACLGTELSLASDSLPFGPVVLGSRVVKRLRVLNTGDTGAKYSWDVKALGSSFSVFPAEGYLAPGQDVKLDVAFLPTEVAADIRAERVAMRVEGGETAFLTLSGACVAPGPQPDSVNFSCAVRGSATQTLTLTNPTPTLWQLRPVLTNEYFSGPESVSVPANGKAPYIVSFKPLSMSSPEAPHEGSVFFPIPDGTGLLYRWALE